MLLESGTPVIGMTLPNDRIDACWLKAFYRQFSINAKLIKRGPEDGKKLGRNDKCHCGSGKKYKKCCLERDLQQQRKSASGPSEEELLFEPESTARLDQDTHDWGETEPEYFEDMDGNLETDKQKEPAF